MYIYALTLPSGTSLRLVWGDNVLLRATFLLRSRSSEPFFAAGGTVCCSWALTAAIFSAKLPGPLAPTPSSGFSVVGLVTTMDFGLSLAGFASFGNTGGGTLPLAAPGCLVGEVISATVLASVLSGEVGRFGSFTLLLRGLGLVSGPS